ncbi:unnamed protein product [Amoebophrya sp. A25]|nr:unnamed protein product [Amoebophrya sp. A25]|eukprot:GSA25T00000921001.1
MGFADGDIYDDVSRPQSRRVSFALESEAISPDDLLLPPAEQAPPQTSGLYYQGLGGGALASEDPVSCQTTRQYLPFPASGIYTDSTDAAGASSRSARIPSEDLGDISTYTNNGRTGDMYYEAPITAVASTSAQAQPVVPGSLRTRAAATASGAGVFTSGRDGSAADVAPMTDNAWTRRGSGASTLAEPALGNNASSATAARTSTEQEEPRIGGSRGSSPSRSLLTADWTRTRVSRSSERTPQRPASAAARLVTYPDLSAHASKPGPQQEQQEKNRKKRQYFKDLHAKVNYPQIRKRTIKPDHDHPFLSRKDHLWLKPEMTTSANAGWFQEMGRERPPSAESSSSNFGLARSGARSRSGSTHVLYGICNIRGTVSARYLAPFGLENVRGQLKEPSVVLWEIVGALNGAFPAAAEHNERNCFIRCLYPRGFLDCQARPPVSSTEEDEGASNSKLGVRADENDLYLACDGLRLRITDNERERACFTLERHADGTEKIAFEHYYVREESGVYHLTTNEAHASRFKLQWDLSATPGAPPMVDGTTGHVAAGGLIDEAHRHAVNSKFANRTSAKATESFALELRDASLAPVPSGVKIVEEDRMHALGRWKGRIRALKESIQSERVLARRAEAKELALRKKIHQMMKYTPEL